MFVYFLLLQVSASDRNWFGAPTFRVFYFEIQLAWVLLPVFDVLSEQIVTSELLLRQCLSVLTEMTFAWPAESATAVVFFCLQSPLHIRNIIPFSGEKIGDKSPPCPPASVPSVVPGVR